MFKYFFIKLPLFSKYILNLILAISITFLWINISKNLNKFKDLILVPPFWIKFVNQQKNDVEEKEKKSLSNVYSSFYFNLRAMLEKLFLVCFFKEKKNGYMLIQKNIFSSMHVGILTWTFNIRYHIILPTKIYSSHV